MMSSEANRRRVSIAPRTGLISDTGADLTDDALTVKSDLTGTVPASIVLLQSLEDRAQDYVAAAKAPNTRRAYLSDWRAFTAWCGAHDIAALPASPETITYYLADQADHCKIATLQRRLSSISQAHESAGHPSPTKATLVRFTWQGIRNVKARIRGSEQIGKEPAVIEHLRRMVDAQPASLIGIRNRALLLFGFAGAFRRSEIAALDFEDVETAVEGLIVTLRRSKTDQSGEGRKVGIPYGRSSKTCPVQALRAWVEVAGIQSEALFRSVNRHSQIKPGRLPDAAIAAVVKKAAAAAGLDPDRFGGHSLRAGLATSAAAAGVEERSIQQQTGHRSVSMLRRYVRHGSLFRENAAASVGL